MRTLAPSPAPRVASKVACPRPRVPLQPLRGFRSTRGYTPPPRSGLLVRGLRKCERACRKTHRATGLPPSPLVMVRCASCDTPGRPAWVAPLAPYARANRGGLAEQSFKSWSHKEKLLRQTAPPFGGAIGYLAEQSHRADQRVCQGLESNVLRGIAVNRRQASGCRRERPARRREQPAAAITGRTGASSRPRHPPNHFFKKPSSVFASSCRWARSFAWYSPCRLMVPVKRTSFSPAATSAQRTMPSPAGTT